VFFGKVFTTIWRNKLSTQKLQMISVRDIERIVLACFNSPDVYNERAISLAGIPLRSVMQTRSSRRRRASYMECPSLFQFAAKGLLWAIKEVDIMLEWFAEEEYGAELQFEELIDWKTWLAEENGWVQKE
jgi:hypothetical protein